MKLNPVVLSVFAVLFFTFGCHQKETSLVQTKPDPTVNKERMLKVMKIHLDAVANKDLETLKSTLSPNGEMQLILPGQDIIFSTQKFIDFHRKWFKDNSWTFETKILNADIGDTFGMVVTELTYREPERDGQPYFNRQIVSYDLKKIDGNWYVIKDHCTSAEKSTDKN